MTRAPLATSPFRRQVEVAPTTEGFVVGDRVTDDRFGLGRITKVCTREELISVDFGDGTIRHIRAGTKGLHRL